MRISSPARAFFILSAAVVVLISCGKNPETSGGKASSPSAAPAAPAAAQPAPLTPGISKGLKHNATTPVYNFDSLGPINYPAVQKSNQVSADSEIAISGWALDVSKKGLAGGVDVVLDQNPYSAQYGLARKDVADHFNQPEFTNSGFLLALSRGQFNKGPHTVSIRIISADKKSYTEGPTVAFIVN